MNVEVLKNFSLNAETGEIKINGTPYKNITYLSMVMKDGKVGLEFQDMRFYASHEADGYFFSWLPNEVPH
mgnify:CR=1 FL=1